MSYSNTNFHNIKKKTYKVFTTNVKVVFIGKLFMMTLYCRHMHLRAVSRSHQRWQASTQSACTPTRVPGSPVDSWYDPHSCPTQYNAWFILIS